MTDDAFTQKVRELERLSIRVVREREHLANLEIIAANIGHEVARQRVALALCEKELAARTAELCSRSS